ncbi:hypothetical protein E2562_033030 [Oryza meyeriana var. granulata]|uniref:Uncharacterized protein n=1 Tax=Oryza meyeriana var. granulata TaxID=110450 RepID=A0A6G1CVS8_9ORYZ|nr:hypothetical protein E2562_033030 [Oryza meyeriana var. granulata]
MRYPPLLLPLGTSRCVPPPALPAVEQVTHDDDPDSASGAAPPSIFPLILLLTPTTTQSRRPAIGTLSSPSPSPLDALHASPVYGAEPPNSNSLYQEILSQLADEVDDAAADEAVAASSAVTIPVWGKDHAHTPPLSGSLMRYFSGLRPEPDEMQETLTVVIF